MRVLFCGKNGNQKDKIPIYQCAVVKVVAVYGVVVLAVVWYREHVQCLCIGKEYSPKRVKNTH